MPAFDEVEWKVLDNAIEGATFAVLLAPHYVQTGEDGLRILHRTTSVAETQAVLITLLDQGLVDVHPSETDDALAPTDAERASRDNQNWTDEGGFVYAVGATDAGEAPHLNVTSRE